MGPLFFTEEQQEEYESSMRQDAMTQGEWMTAAVQQYAAVYGEDRPDQEYILSPHDTWEKNPHYRGKPGRHPEDYAPECEEDCQCRYCCPCQAEEVTPIPLMFTENGEDDIIF